MKPKQLAILGVVVVVLLGLVVLKEWSERPPDITEQVDLQPLVPEGITGADLARLELYVGGKPEQKVVLERTEDGTDWRVASYFNAPVSDTKIDKYLDSLIGLKGEARPTSDDEGVLASYELTDDKAFHIFGYKKDGPEPAVHLLVGKEADYRTVFMRPADSHAVYVVNTNLRREAGLYDPSAELKADTWLDKKVVDLTADDVVRVALNQPDKQLVFEKREKPAEEKADTEEGVEGEKETEKPSAPATPETEWVVAEGGPGLPLKQQSAMLDYLRTFTSLMATDIVDPSKKSDYGLESPDYRVALKVKDSDSEVVLEGGRPGPDADEGYIRVASDKADRVYKVSKSSFERVFPKGSQFFDLAGLSLDVATLDRIEVVQPEGNIVAVKKDNAWALEQPSAGLKVKPTALSDMASALANWKPADYAASAEGRGFENSTRRVTFTAGPGVSHTIVLGGDAQSVDGAYARLDGGEAVLVMAQDVKDKVFLTPGKLFDLKLVETPATDITQITLTRDGETVTATRAGDENGAGSGWTLTVNGAEVPASKTALDDLAYAVAGLEADDLRLYTAPSAEAVHATVSYTPRDGESRTITIGPKVEDAYPATVSGEQGVFMLSEVDVQGLTPATDALKEEASAEGESEGATAASEEGATAETDSAPAAPTPTETAPAEPATEAAPTDTTPAEPAPEAAPADTAPAGPATEAAPMDTTPAEPAPTDTAPAESASEATPTDTAPAEPAPQTSPADAAPAEPAPQAAPADAAPTEPAPASPDMPETSAAASEPVAPTAPLASEAPDASAPAETPAEPAPKAATTDVPAPSVTPAAEPAPAPSAPESAEPAPVPAPVEPPSAPETTAPANPEPFNAAADATPAPEEADPAPAHAIADSPAPAGEPAVQP